MTKDTANGNDSDGVECPVCGREYGSRAGLSYHIRNNHPEELDHECPTCERAFPTAAGMKSHHKLSHGESIALVTVDCGWCGGGVTVQESTLRDENKFCSDKCESKWRSERYSGETHPRYRKQAVECSQCGTGIKRIPARLGAAEHHFCTRDCQKEWLSEANSGDGNPQWCGGFAPYGPGWNNAKKDRVRERDGYECQDPRCDMTQEEHLEKYDRKLYVHHIQKARSFDNAEDRNDERNLISLCAKCHPHWEKMSPLRPDTAT